MESLDHLAAINDPLLACCLCKGLLQDAVQLTCLHSCCRQCFSTAASIGSGQGVNCISCGVITQVGCEQPNGFIDSQVQRYRLITESRVCGKCKENGEYNKPALKWCSACRHSLCEDCDAVHTQYFRQHVTLSLEEIRSVDEVCSQASHLVCVIHRKPLDIACLNCEQAKCISCWAECKEKQHEMHIVGEEAFDSYVGKIISSISTMEIELQRKSEVLDMPKSILCDTKAARDRHLEELNKRKRRVVDAVETVYQQIEYSTKNAYDDLEADGEVAVASASRIASDLSEVRSYVRRFVESNNQCEIFNQQKIVRERLRVFSAELDSLRNCLSTTKKEVKMETSLPEDVEDAVRAWIGVPLVHSASSSPPAPPQLHEQHEQHAQQEQEQQQQEQQQQEQQQQEQEQQQQEQQQPQEQPQEQQEQQQEQQQQQCFSFGASSASVQLPFPCRDVVLTKDGRSLLLAAEQRGLVEFSSSSGRELSRWRPPKHSSGKDDKVLAVAALSDGRAAVSLLKAQLVVLLRRNEKGSGAAGINWWRRWIATVTASDGWTEDRRLDPLPWPVACLSVHGDVLATSQLLGRGLQLLSLSSGRRLSDAALQREYKIGSLALSAYVVVTASEGNVTLGSSRRVAYVLDAHSLTEGVSDERLWRHVLSSGNEKLCGISVDSSGGCLYAAVCMSDLSSGRVSALSLGDGSELRRVALCIDFAAAAQLLLLPWKVSLSDDGAAAARHQRQSSGSSSGGRTVLLAVLSLNKNMVLVHRSTSDQLQLQSFSFGAASANKELLVDCEDVALTIDGRSLLLAAGQHGLLEFSSSLGREMSCWRPPKHIANTDDEVLAVAALSDGRAAVSLLHAQLIVLLRRNKEDGRAAGSSWWQKLTTAVTAGDAWTEDRRLDPLPWPAECLSAHGDVLAASEWLGPGLQLLSLSSGRWWSKAKLRRDYNIGSMAVSAWAVVTGSADKVEISDGLLAAHVLDAHSLVGGSDVRLWRHVLSSSDEEQLCGVCADSSGGCLYAAVWRSDESSGRVSVLSLWDGSEIKRVALSFDSAAAPQQSLRPWRLSLSDDGASAAEQQRLSSRSDSNMARGSSGDSRVVLLAVLSWNETTVSVHRSTSCVLQ